jgi:hypothetical protein
MTARLDVPSRHELVVAPKPMITPTQFIDVVDRVLGPVLSTKGFALVATDDFTVEFRGASALLVVRYEERSHELSLWLSNYEDDSGEPPLELPDALRATDCPASDVDSVGLIQTHEVEPLQRLLSHVAEVIAKCATRFLEGDRASFDAARRIRAERARAYTAQVVNAPAIAEADSAWQARDYALVCEMLRPIRDELDDTHRRRLAFAESRL